MTHSPSDTPANSIALTLDGSGGATHVDWHRDRSLPSNQSYWVHLNFEHPDTAAWLWQHSGLSDIAIHGLLASETRPRLVTRGENLLLTVRGVNLNTGSDPDDMVSVRIWTDGRRVISTFARKLMSTQDVVDSLQEGHGPTTTPGLVIMWLARIVDRMEGTLDELEDSVLTLEEQAISSDGGSSRAEFARLRRQCITLRRYLSPQREALSRLAGEPLPWLDDTDRLRLREIADRQIRHVESLDEIRERAAVAHEEMVSQLSEQMNERMYVMSIAAALFLPLGFFTGLMGINVGGMPGVENPQGFWLVAGACGLALAGLLIVFRRKGWL